MSAWVVIWLMIYQRLDTKGTLSVAVREMLVGSVRQYVLRAEDGEPWSYRLDRIEGATITDVLFVPRFAIELTPGDSVWLPPVG